MTTPITDEMPDTWVRQLTAAIEAHGHTVADAHESAIVIDLTPETRQILDADDDDRHLVVGWSEAGGCDWGLSADGAHVPDPQPLGGTYPGLIAHRAHVLLRTGQPEPGEHPAVPYAAASEACTCPVQSCGGIIPDPGCPDHGDRRNPAMAWHWEYRCANHATEESNR